MTSETSPIDPRPQWLTNHQTENETVYTISIDGKNYPYTLVQHGVILPELPYAVGFESKKELYISENVPTVDRRHILAHEVREKMKFSDLPEEERCAAALTAELREAELIMSYKNYKKYVQRRTQYFNSALRFYEEDRHAPIVTPEFRNGLILATGRINHIARNLR